LPALIAAAGERAARRVLEFFAANIRNPHTRRAYAHAVAGFMTWCDANRVGSITAVQPPHVAAWIEQQTRDMRHRPPSCGRAAASVRLANSTEETLANLGLPPNRHPGNMGFLVHETDGRFYPAAQGGCGHIHAGEWEDRLDQGTREGLSTARA
jgi:hypothetical protein